MSTNRVRLSVEFDHTALGIAHCIHIEVPDILVNTWDSVDKCDDTVMTYLSPNAVLAHSTKAHMIVERRKTAARELATELADAIYESMCKHDTINGYEVKDV